LPLTQRPEGASARLIHRAPNVVAGQADVLPAERSDVTEQVLVDRPTVSPQLAIGGLQISGVPEDYGCDEQVEPGRTEELVLEGTIAHLAEPAEVDGESNVCADRGGLGLSGPRFGSNVHVTSKMSYTQSTFV